MLKIAAIADGQDNLPEIQSATAKLSTAGKDKWCEVTSRDKLPNGSNGKDLSCEVEIQLKTRGNDKKMHVDEAQTGSITHPRKTRRASFSITTNDVASIRSRITFY